MFDDLIPFPGHDASAFEIQCAQMLCMEEGDDPNEIVTYGWQAPDGKEWKIEQFRYFSVIGRVREMIRNTEARITPHRSTEVGHA